MKEGASLLGRLILGYGGGAVAAGLASTFCSAIGDGLNHDVKSTLVAAAGLAGAGLGYARWRRDPRRLASTAHGSAYFADLAGVAGTQPGGDGLIVGRAIGDAVKSRRFFDPSTSRVGQGFLQYEGPAHLITIAPTRSGKGVGAIVPNLLVSPRSIVCVDPKGENAALTADARARFGPVYVLDPFGVSGRTSAAFNPLSDLNAQSPDLAEDAFAIADALIYDAPGQSGEAHWNEEAKALICGVILHVVTAWPIKAQTLSLVRELLTSAPDRMSAMLDDMAASQAAGGLVARAANRHLSKSDREAAGVLSSAQRHTHFLDSPRMTGVLQRSDFRFEDLKAGAATVFLVLPPDRLATHARWLRLLVVQALFALARSGPRSATSAGAPVLFLLDEFAALGHLQPILTAFGLMAGYGVQMWVILQDLHQLKGVYAKNAGTFLSNAGLIQIFNVADVETATWVSRALGASTEAFETFGASTTRGPAQLTASRGFSSHVNLTRRDLLTPDEIMRLSADRLLLLRPGSPPTVAGKVRYYQDSEFRGLYQAPREGA